MLRLQALAGNRAVAATIAQRNTNQSGASAGVVQRTIMSADEITGLTLQQVTARLAANEREAAPLVLNEDYRAALGVENIRLKQRYVDLVRGEREDPRQQTSVQDDPVASITEELAEVEQLVARMVAEVPAHPRDQALNVVRGVADRLRLDQELIAQFTARGGAQRTTMTAALARIRQLHTMFTPVLAQAEQWHTTNPAGDSLGMMNEAAGTQLAGHGLAHWARGGWYYISGTVAFIAAGAVAVVDAGEQMLSFGFHDAATAVSRAYTRGDISWNEGESILRSAAWRALLTAAITRGAGSAVSKLSGAAVRGIGLAPQSVNAGLVTGAIAGGANAAVSLGAQSLLTLLLRSHFHSPQARMIWRRGLPSGSDWALAIPLGMLLGARSGARTVRLGNAELVGSTFETSDGATFRIVAITPDGQVVVAPVGSVRAPPPPPPAVIEMVFDPATDSWGPTDASTTSLPPGRTSGTPGPAGHTGAAAPLLLGGSAPRTLPAPAMTSRPAVGVTGQVSGAEEGWSPSRSWNGPVNHGRWTGVRGNSGWIDDRPEVMRVVGRSNTGEANAIFFNGGVVDFSPWSQGEIVVSGLTGVHAQDMIKIRVAIAERQNLLPGGSRTARANAALEWLREAPDGFGGVGLRPHHAGGNRIQLIPRDLHKVQHTDLAIYPRE
ncbi:hypothetical protein ACWEGE_05870 [Amycolatopsis sp. NPDC004747]